MLVETALGTVGAVAGILGITGLAALVALMFCRAAAMGDRCAPRPPRTSTVRVIRDIGTDVDAVTFDWSHTGRMERNGWGS